REVKKMKHTHSAGFNTFRFGTAAIAALVLLLGSLSAMAETAAELDRDVDSAYQKLMSSSPAARELASVSKGVLVFPSIVKAGLVIGGQYGKGALRVKGKTTGYYNTTAASFGLQAGAQSFGYAMFFMTNDALKYLDKSDGWEVGVGPTLVVVDEGVARSLSTSTAKEDVYVFFFDQKGLMAGLGVQGSKITRITMDK
ncbi:MAG: YSC84-related protein, partial [Spongiibacteraceae bacterium]